MDGDFEGGERLCQGGTFGEPGGGAAWGDKGRRGGYCEGGGDSAIWYGMVWYGMVWYGMVWYGMVWYGMVWYGMVWYGMVWYQLQTRLPLLVPPQCLPLCQGASPVRGTTCPCDPGSLPRRGGRACAPVRNGGGMGGGMEGPLVRGPAGPRFPSLPAATPPRQGRGLRPVRRWSKGGGGGGDYVWSIPWCPSLCPVCGRPRGMAGGGLRPGPGAWVAAGGRGGGGAMRVRGPWRSRGGVGGPAGGRRWP